MLAEKFFLIFETLIRFAAQPSTYADGAPKVKSQSPFVPVKLPEGPK